MKRMILLSGLFMLVIICLRAAERTVSRPAFSAWAQNSLEIDKVMMNDTETVFYIDAFYNPNQWIRIDKSSYLKLGNKKYFIKELRQAQLDSFIWMPQSGNRSFQMVFPALPPDVTEVDFIEGDHVENAFKIWGIRLDETLPQTLKFSNTATQEPSVITPAHFKEGTYVLNGKLLGYSPQMSLDSRLVYLNVLTNEYQITPIQIQPDGSFEVRADLIASTEAWLRFSDISIDVLLTPGKSASVEVNLPEFFREQSRHRSDQPSLGLKCLFTGEMAGINNERANDPLPVILLTPYTSKRMDDLAKNLSTATFEEAQAYVEKRYEEELSQIKQAKSMSPARKQLIVNNLNISALNVLLDCTQQQYIEHLYRLAHNVPRDSALTGFKFTQPNPDYAAIFGKYLINDPILLYSELGYRAQMLYMTNYLNRPGPTSANKGQMAADGYYIKDFYRVAGIEGGFLKEMLEARRLAEDLSNFLPFTDEKLKLLDSITPSLRSVLLALNNRLIETIEENKKKSGYTVNRVNITNIPNEELFTTMMSPYRGKVVFVDFWATWCGPCVSAMKQAEPVKEGYKDNEVVFLYLAGENSPKGAWERKISDIKGDHYRVSGVQWDHMCKQFEIGGVPTYLIVDKNGTVVRNQTGFMGVEKMKKWIDNELTK